MSAARRLTEADADSLRALRLRGLQEHPLDFGADYEEEAAQSSDQWRERLKAAPWFGVEQEGELIACGFLRASMGRRVRHNGWVHAMYVATEAQGSRAADAIMDAIEAEARATGVTHLKLDVREDNLRAAGFYRRRGFEAFGRDPVSLMIDGAPWPALLMIKAL